MARKQLGVPPSDPTDAVRLVDIPTGGGGEAGAKGAATTAASTFPTTVAAVPGMSFTLAPGTYAVSGLMLFSKSAAANAPRFQILDVNGVGVAVSILGITTSTSSSSVGTSITSAPNAGIGFTTSVTTGVFTQITGSIIVPPGASAAVAFGYVTSGTGTATLAVGSSISFTPLAA
jgi:hypothetical protein